MPKQAGRKTQYHSVDWIKELQHTGKKFFKEGLFGYFYGTAQQTMDGMWSWEKQKRGCSLSKIWKYLKELHSFLELLLPVKYNEIIIQSNLWGKGGNIMKAPKNDLLFKLGFVGAATIVFVLFYIVTFHAVDSTGQESLYLLLCLPLFAVAIIAAAFVFIRKMKSVYDAQLYKGREQIHTIFESIGDGIITTDMCGKVLEINNAAEKMIGWKKEDALGRIFADMIDNPDKTTDRDRYDSLQEVITTQKACQLCSHATLTPLNGTKTDVVYSAAPIKDKDGKSTGVVITLRDVSEQKMTERLMTSSEEKFRTIFEQASVGICLVSQDRFFISQNQRICEMLGYSEQELAKTSVIDITYAEDIEIGQDVYLKLIDGTMKTMSFEKRYIKSDGTIMWAHLSVSLVRDLENRPNYFIVTVQDITGSKLAEMALVTSESRLKKAQAMAHVGNWELEIKSRLVWASDEVYRIYGIERNGAYLPLETLHAMIHNEERPKVAFALNLLVEQDEKYDVEFRIVSGNDNRKKTVHSTAVVEKDSFGNACKVIGTIQDITERKWMEANLKAWQEQFRVLYEQAPIGLGIIGSSTGRIYRTNKKFREITCKTEEELTNMDWEDTTHPDDVLVNWENIAFLNTGKGSNYQTEKRYLRPDGSSIWAKVTVSQIESNISKNNEYLCMIEDVSERVKAEQALVASEAKHRAMVANISDVISIIDGNGVIIYNSPNVTLWFGWHPEDLIGNDIWAVIHPDDRERVKAEIQSLLEKDGAEKTAEFRCICKDGTNRVVESTGINLLSDENIKGILINYRDISERKKREEEIFYLYYHDVLTGLYNRAFFIEERNRLDTGRQLPLSVIIGDINGLKLINDAFGHTEGDKLLIEVANILKQCTRREDIVARTGGDEFCILLPQTNSAEAHTILSRIEEACKESASKADGGTYYASISLGQATKLHKEEAFNSVLNLAEENMYKRKLLERKNLHGSIIASIKTTMFEKSNETEAHTQRLVDLSMALGQEIGLPDDQLNELELLCSIHDIGKISIDKEVLCKPSKLTEEEWYLLKKHPEVGSRIAQAAPELKHIAEYILCHHERWDGAGYPQGLNGENIPLLSRVLAVVDAFDAMTQDKPYRKAMGKEEALAEIRKNAGAQFDPAIVEAFDRYMNNPDVSGALSFQGAME